jgi:hypothetical protein
MANTDRLQKKLSEVSGIASSLDASQRARRRRIWFRPILAALILGAIGYWVHRSVDGAMRQDLARGLKTILDADTEALRVWTADQEAISRSIAQSPAVRSSVKELVALAEGKHSTQTTLVQSPAQGELRASLAPYLANFRYTDFFLISPSYEIIASNTDAPIKTIRLDDYRRSFVQQAMKGRAGVLKPIRALGLLPDAKGELKSGLPTIMVCAPVQDANGKSMAVLSLRIKPEAQFSEIFRTARFGDSGETYALSREGLLLSESRFDDDLKRLGLLPDLPDSQSILTVEARDPQVNMMAGQRPSLTRAEQPLTQLAEHAAAGGQGVLTDAYRDYRGVPSIGAWRWLPKHGFAVVTEVDVAEAFRPLYILRRAFWVLLGLLVLSGGGIFLATLVVARQQRRAEKAEKQITRLGQYTLEEKIGGGGMGSVYKARHAFLRRPTAVKMLDKEHVNESALARFEREVQLTSLLNHPNTIAVYDFGRTPEGVFYYAMEYLEGIDLEELVNKFGPLPEGRSVRILEQVCGSLAEAHAVGLIHRDIKPANVILSCRAGISDFVKVLDFGLVKAAETDEKARLTQANVTLGTPHYMSPEAVEASATVTPLSDIYSIGAVGYFLVTGTTVFSGKTVLDVCMKQARAEPESPSRRAGRQIDPGLEAIILRCLAKNPKDRPASTEALRQELAQLDIRKSWTAQDADAWWAQFREDIQSAARGAATQATTLATAAETPSPQN